MFVGQIDKMSREAFSKVLENNQPGQRLMNGPKRPIFSPDDRPLKYRQTNHHLNTRVHLPETLNRLE